MLKGRWKCLTNLSSRIRRDPFEQDYKHAHDIMTVSIILHNFLVEQRETVANIACNEFRGARPYGPTEYIMDAGQLLEEPAEDDMDDPIVLEGKKFRASLMPRILEAGRSAEGIITYKNNQRSQ
jgi:hypothetical protein